MATKPVALVLGAGPRIGTSVAEKFASLGYRVAIASRSGTGSKSDKGFLSLKADFTKPESVPGLFDAVKNEFHAPPSVVVYNAAALTPPPEKESPLSIPAEAVVSDLNVNTVSPYVAAQEALRGWEALPKETKKSFIYTGNWLNVRTVPTPLFVNLGMGKSASSFWIGVADKVYAAQGIRFFYADERNEDGSAKSMNIEGESHADFFAQLADHEGDIPWLATFVKGRGYVEFQ